MKNSVVVAGLSTIIIRLSVVFAKFQRFPLDFYRDRNSEVLVRFFVIFTGFSVVFRSRVF